MRKHVGSNAGCNTVQRLDTRSAKALESRVWPALLHRRETSVQIKSGHDSDAREITFEDQSSGARSASGSGSMPYSVNDQINHLIAKVR